MKNSTPPIRRSNELAPLSREHHEGLLFVWKLRQGLKTGIDTDRINSFCAWSWEHHFAPHFQKEESELLPVLGHQHQMIQQMLEEHKAIAAKFNALKEVSVAADIEQLAQMLNDHIRFEERQLFPLVEQTATPQQMQVLDKALVTEEVCGVWEDEFWKK